MVAAQKRVDAFCLERGLERVDEIERKREAIRLLRRSVELDPSHARACASCLVPAPGDRPILVVRSGRRPGPRTAGDRRLDVADAALPPYDLVAVYPRTGEIFIAATVATVAELAREVVLEHRPLRRR